MKTLVVADLKSETVVNIFELLKYPLNDLEVVLLELADPKCAFVRVPSYNQFLQRVYKTKRLVFSTLGRTGLNIKVKLTETSYLDTQIFVNNLYDVHRIEPLFTVFLSYPSKNYDSIGAVASYLRDWVPEIKEVTTVIGDENRSVSVKGLAAICACYSAGAEGAANILTDMMLDDLL